MVENWMEPLTAGLEGGDRLHSQSCQCPGRVSIYFYVGGSTNMGSFWSCVILVLCNRTSYKGRGILSRRSWGECRKSRGWGRVATEHPEWRAPVMMGVTEEPPARFHRRQSALHTCQAQGLWCQLRTVSVSKNVLSPHHPPPLPWQPCGTEPGWWRFGWVVGG